LKSSRRKTVDGSPTSATDANGVSHTVVKPDIRPPSAASFPDGSQLGSSDTFDFLLSELKASLPSDQEEDPSSRTIHNVAPTPLREPATVHSEDLDRPTLATAYPSPVELDATRTALEMGPADPWEEKRPRERQEALFGKQTPGTHDDLNLNETSNPRRANGEI